MCNRTLAEKYNLHSTILWIYELVNYFFFKKGTVKSIPCKYNALILATKLFLTAKRSLDFFVFTTGFSALCRHVRSNPARYQLFPIICKRLLVCMNNNHSSRHNGFSKPFPSNTQYTAAHIELQTGIVNMPYHLPSGIVTIFC